MSPALLGWLADPALAQGWSRSDLGNEQQMTSLAAGDLDGDGDLDLAGVSYLQDRIVVFENRGARAWGPSAIAEPVRATGVELGDLDGDGALDLVYTTASRVYVSAGDGAFGFTRTASSPSVGFGWAEGPSVGDLDGDGDLDVAFAQRDGDRLDWWENLGGGVMGATLRPVAPLADGPSFTALADLDADGALDLVGALDRAITAYPNIGDGTFGAVRTIAVGDRGSTVRPADLDGDGAPDLVASFQATHEISLAFNDGAGGFPTSERLIVPAPYDAQAADLDRDGDLDLVYSSSSDGRVRWIERTGATWGAERTVGLVDDGVDLALGDYDLDGATDVAVVAYYGAPTTIVFWNNLPRGTDADGDGVRDDLDACPGEDDRADTDGDGAPDGCDRCPLGADTDGDGGCDAGDRCPLDAPPDDDDGDATCDADDRCPGGSDAEDRDGDLLPDACDPCPVLAGEVDADADGAWACDDCDDARPEVRPGAVEVPGDGVDADCDGLEACFVDLDDDGFGDGEGSGDLACAGPGLAPLPGDCDDGDAAAHPGAWDAPGSGADEDCDGVARCWSDEDGDGAGAAPPAVGADEACVGAGIAPAADDCAPADPARHPGAEEVPRDGVDEDCDGAETCPVDADGDGYGGPDLGASPALDCRAPGFAPEATDCDDADPAAWPGADEVCDDGVDQDCDGADLPPEDCPAGPPDEPGPAGGGRGCSTAPGLSWLGVLALAFARRRSTPGQSGGGGPSQQWPASHSNVSQVSPS